MNDINRMKMLAGIPAQAKPETKLLKEDHSQLVELLMQEAKIRAATEAKVQGGQPSPQTILAHAQRITADVLAHVQALISSGG